MIVINNAQEKLPLSETAAARREYRDGNSSVYEDEVVCEHFREMIVNGIHVLTLSCSPSDLTELAVGRLKTEGMIDNTDDIEKIFICGKGEICEVTLTKQLRAVQTVPREPSCCTGNKVYAETERKFPVLPCAEPDMRKVFELADRFGRDGKLHKSTGGTHSCYLHTGRDIVSFEDIGRHNAVDKAVGYMLMQGLDPACCMLFTTGRIADDMAVKAVMSGIPVLVSKSVPTHRAILTAKEHSLTLICKAWPDSCTVICDGGR